MQRLLSKHIKTWQGRLRGKPNKEKKRKDLPEKDSSNPNSDGKQVARKKTTTWKRIVFTSSCLPRSPLQGCVK